MTTLRAERLARATTMPIRDAKGVLPELHADRGRIPARLHPSPIGARADVGSVAHEVPPGSDDLRWSPPAQGLDGLQIVERAGTTPTRSRPSRSWRRSGDSLRRRSNERGDERCTPEM